MHETRNLIVVILLIAAFIWAFLSWLVFASLLGSAETNVWVQRGLSLFLVAGFSIWCWYALNVEDKLPDQLAATVGPVYYDADGLAFMPTVRIKSDSQAELSLYYLNRYENYAQVIVHLRPLGDCFFIREGMRDMHFAFKANGGDFGVLHQPIGVPHRLQGDVVEIHMAAVTRFPRSHGTRLIKHEGMPCGTLTVDWGQAFKVGVHEVSGEIELTSPATLHLSMPIDANETIRGSDTWKQELLEPGPSESFVLG